MATAGTTDGDGHVFAARFGDLGVPFAQHTQPPAEVAVAVGPWRTVMGPDREVHLAPGAHQLFGDLHAGGASAHHQHSAFGQLLGVVVGGRVDLVQALVLRGDGRNHRALERTGRGHYAVGTDHAFVGFDGEAWAVGVAYHLLHFNAGPYGQVVLAHVGLEVVGDLVLAGEGIRVEVEFQAREAVVPDRAVGHQRIPAPGAPGLGDALALQHRCGTPSLLRCSLMATPAWPAPTTSVDFDVVQCHV